MAADPKKGAQRKIRSASDWAASPAFRKEVDLRLDKLDKKDRDAKRKRVKRYKSSVAAAPARAAAGAVSANLAQGSEQPSDAAVPSPTDSPVMREGARAAGSAARYVGSIPWRAADSVYRRARRESAPPAAPRRKRPLRARARRKIARATSLAGHRGARSREFKRAGRKAGARVAAQLVHARRRAVLLLAAPVTVLLLIGAIIFSAAFIAPFMALSGSASMGGGLSGNAYEVYLYLHTKGMGDVPIAAILGNMQQESGMNPANVNSLGATGLCQWLGGRADALRAFADSRGESWATVSLQCEFLYTQDEYPGASWRAGFEADEDVDHATKTWFDKYERAGDSTLGIRQKYAREFLQKIRTGMLGSSYIPYFCQHDSRWKDHAYGHSTLGSGGCSPTSLAMVVSAAKGSEVTPDVVADWAGDRYWVDGQGTVNGSMYRAAAEKWGLGGVSSCGSIASAVAALRAGHPVICSQGPGYFTKNGHLIVLRGMSGDKVLVHDPANPSNSNREFTQAEIDAAAGTYYIFEGVTLSSSFAGDAAGSSRASEVVAAAQSTPHAGAHMCATWVTSVYDKLGIHVTGSASTGYVAGENPQMFEKYCKYRDRSKLAPGMIIAMKYAPIGHVGIYLGNDQVISSETWNGRGKVVVRTVDDWIATFSSGKGQWEVAWGYPPGM